MSKKLQKSLQEYISKIKKQNQNDHRFPTIDSITSSLNHRKLSKMFSGCKHQPKTLSFTIDHNYTLPRHRRKDRFVEKEDEEEQGEATLSDIDRFLVQNFKSLYGKKDDLEESDVESHTSDQTLGHGEIEEEKNRLGDYFDKSPQADIFDGAGCSSGSTTSYVNKSLQPAMCTREKDARSVPDECIVVLKRSSSLYEDFWNSMKDLIEARMENGGGASDGEFLQEMLLCFLHLNEKKYYRYIVRAFVDLTADLKQFGDTQG
ncbi:unnamed protein product [Rhodiola kirilowii]